MAGHELIDAYLAELSRRLPAPIVDELSDGLHETWHRHLAQGRVDAAQAAITEFGHPAQVIDAFVAGANGRAVARALLATGPVVGFAWGTCLVAARFWTWSIPAGATAAVAVALAGVVACLVVAATSRHHYHRTRLGHVGAVGLVALDLSMVAALVLSARALIWPMAVAVAASLARAGVVLLRQSSRA